MGFEPKKDKIRGGRCYSLGLSSLSQSSLQEEFRFHSLSRCLLQCLTTCIVKTFLSCVKPLLQLTMTASYLHAPLRKICLYLLYNPFQVVEGCSEIPPYTSVFPSSLTFSSSIVCSSSQLGSWPSSVWFDIFRLWGETFYLHKVQKEQKGKRMN